MQIFISHSSKDEAWVELLKKRIEASGTTVYLAQYDFTGVGQTLTDKLESAIDASDAVVVLLTKKTKSSPIVGSEIGYARAKSKRIIPLVAPEVAHDPAALGMLNGVEYISFDLDDPHEGLLKLTDVINQMVKRQLEEQHEAEQRILSNELAKRDVAYAQLQSSNDTLVVLLVFATAIAAVAFLSGSD